jgi:hypothetical protein
MDQQDWRCATARFCKAPGYSIPQQRLHAIVRLCTQNYIRLDSANLDLEIRRQRRRSGEFSAR